MICPIHKSELKVIDIVKVGSRRVHGLNYYCPKRDCTYETDKGTRGKGHEW
jgi:hypothetical protein